MRRDTEAEYDDMPAEACLRCGSPDPQVRSAHHLELAKAGGLDVLKPHLYRHAAQNASLTTADRRERIESLCLWVAGLLEMYAGFADEATGAPLPWWETRRRMVARKGAIAEAAYQRAPEGYRQAH